MQYQELFAKISLNAPLRQQYFSDKLKYVEDWGVVEDDRSAALSLIQEEVERNSKVLFQKRRKMVAKLAPRTVESLAGEFRQAFAKFSEANVPMTHANPKMDYYSDGIEFCRFLKQTSWKKNLKNSECRWLGFLASERRWQISFHRDLGFIFDIQICYRQKNQAKYLQFFW